MNDKVLPEQLIDVVIAADSVRRQSIGAPPQRFKPSQRRWVEPFFNMLGLAFGQGMVMLPWALRKPFDIWLCRKMGGHAEEPNPHLAERTAQTVSLAQAIHKKTGQWPAFFILTSHPDTEGPLQWLRFELLAQGLQIADRVVEAQDPHALYRPHAQCFLAIDPYALDTVSTPIGAFYAAWMHRTYLAWDRQASTQSWIQRHFLLRGSGYDRIAWRLLQRLRQNIPVLMALPGGLPQNARLLYGAREFIHHLKLSPWPIPKRAVQKKLMEILSEIVEGTLPILQGELPKKSIERIQALLQELGLEARQANDLLQKFTEEFRSPIPDRVRLMNVLARRLLLKNKPLILLAMSHRPDEPHIRVAAPWGLYASGAQQVTVECAASTQNYSLRDVSALARDFSKAFFS
jgi:hypothetical protein